jgi:hypothetical protein
MSLFELEKLSRAAGWLMCVKMHIFKEARFYSLASLC